MPPFVIYFLVGGMFTTLIVLLEESGFRLLSGFAALMPVFTLVSYLFIGSSRGAHAVSEHAKLVLVGTLVAWIPYMLVVAYLSPRIGSHKAIAAGLAVFFVLALIFLVIVSRYGLFRE